MIAVKIPWDTDDPSQKAKFVLKCKEVLKKKQFISVKMELSLMMIFWMIINELKPFLSHRFRYNLWDIGMGLDVTNSLTILQTLHYWASVNVLQSYFYSKASFHLLSLSDYTLEHTVF